MYIPYKVITLVLFYFLTSNGNGSLDVFFIIIC